MEFTIPGQSGQDGNAYGNAYRVRVGDYRIVCPIFDRILIVRITRIARRKEACRGL